ncbi:MAG TPA: hypothetical protein VJ932_06185, partial [Alkalispirochaeta sp.]|nr:hypothetical protein [Alkalispirochaeta sp.]
MQRNRRTHRNRTISSVGIVLLAAAMAMVVSCASPAPTAPPTTASPTSTGGTSDITELVDWSLPPLYGTIDLASGFRPDPFLVEVTAGGNRNLRNVGRVGYVAEAPDFDLNYSSGPYNLYIFVDTQGADTVLIVCDPSGRYFYSDDQIGTRPGMHFSNPESGLYDIWVGTYGSQT